MVKEIDVFCVFFFFFNFSFISLVLVHRNSLGGASQTFRVSLCPDCCVVEAKCFHIAHCASFYFARGRGGGDRNAAHCRSLWSRGRIRTIFSVDIFTVHKYYPEVTFCLPYPLSSWTERNIRCTEVLGKKHVFTFLKSWLCFHFRCIAMTPKKNPKKTSKWPL